MKIVLSTQNIDLINVFIKMAKPLGVEVINAKVDSILKNCITDNEVSVFILGEDTFNLSKFCSLIKKENENTPILVFGHKNEIPYADFFCFVNDSISIENVTKMLFQNSVNLDKKLNKLQKLTAKVGDVVAFKQWSYDPTKRVLCHKDKELDKLSVKAGGLLEMLASNYGEVVKREMILEKVWKKTDYFAGRSLDVFTTHLRKMFEKHGVKMDIRNVSKVGLILQSKS
jgi:DNA-binding winged helix-turn-helix (wHTH) protein